MTRTLWLLALLSCAPTAWGHGFGQRFTLPLPFWLYGTGACAALLLSFVVLLAKTPAMVSATAKRADGGMQPADGSPDLQKPMHTGLVLWLGLNVTLMGLAMLSGAVGSQHAASNFSMTWFWIVFLLGFFYLAVMAGPRHLLLNPWWCASALLAVLRRQPVQWPDAPVLRGTHNPMSRVPPRAVDTRRQTDSPYAALQAWPALAGYLLLIELELFGHASPLRLATFLMGYTALWIMVAWHGGVAVWVRQFDVFAALFGLISRLRTPLSWANPANAKQHPLLQQLPVSLQLLICAMLASTAFDALRESVPWGTQLWQVLLTLFPQPDLNPLAILAALSNTYRYAEMGIWLLMPFAYYAAMALMVAISRALAPSTPRFSAELSYAALALLPLVLGYHMAHYLPLLLSEGPNVLHLLSDPLGEGWNLFGTAHRFRAPILLETDTMWHLQVVLIVLGHLGGVRVSHWQACCFHSTRRAVIRSQIPMLVWMMGLTTWGLWILSQPMKAG